ncbi:nucleotidyltransferase domain-containing protein [Candidatus Woesearchaeota archaeon]|nr:nucleotidyltransferase domain-containing protein [Candidatus Woesearchaeota archaeon]
MLDYFENELLNPVIILFGSLSKAEARSDSDIDIAVFTPTDKKLDLKKYEKILKREIQVMQFHRMENVTNKELLHNILNGYTLSGSW